jgi:hypothetical protein
LNPANDGDLGVRWQLVYGAFETKYGTLVAGQNWTTFMDVKFIPEGLPEPTVSGTIFQRQTMVRWTQPVGSSFFMHVAAEDPSSDDVFAKNADPNFFDTKYPDGVLSLEYVHADRGHLRLTSIVRYLEVNLPAGGDGSGGEEDKTDWGLFLTGKIRLFERDEIAVGATDRKALGRYLLGITPTSGARIDATDSSLQLHKNWGGFLSFQHYWLDALRSTVYGGYAKAEQSGTEPGTAFKSSLFGSANPIWNPFPFLSVGVEYTYGRRENRFGPDFGNHRVLLGFQVF